MKKRGRRPLFFFTPRLVAPEFVRAYLNELNCLFLYTFVYKTRLKTDFLVALAYPFNNTV